MTFTPAQAADFARRQNLRQEIRLKRYHDILRPFAIAQTGQVTPKIAMVVTKWFVDAGGNPTRFVFAEGTQL